MPYTITRQRQFPEGTPVVEVSSGGLDYTNPDALVAKGGAKGKKRLLSPGLEQAGGFYSCSERR